LCFFAERSHHVQVEGVAQAVGQHDGLGLGCDGSLNFAGIDIVCGEVHIHEHRHGTELQDGVDRGGESCRHANHFVALLDGALTQLGAGQGGEGHQIGRGAGVHRDQVFDAQELGQAFLEHGVEAAGGQPAVQRGVDHHFQFPGADDLARHRHGCLPGNEWLGCVGDVRVLLDQFADLAAQLIQLRLEVDGCRGAHALALY
jgi:hypothetical protein